jgi:hypothetical protein
MKRIIFIILLSLISMTAFAQFIRDGDTVKTLRPTTDWFKFPKIVWTGNWKDTIDTKARKADTLYYLESQASANATFATKKDKNDTVDIPTGYVRNWQLLNSGNWDAGYTYRVTGGNNPISVSSNVVSVDTSSTSYGLATLNNVSRTYWSKAILDTNELITKLDTPNIGRIDRDGLYHVFQDTSKWNLAKDSTWDNLQLGLKLNSASPTFTGTMNGDSLHLGLGASIIGRVVIGTATSTNKLEVNDEIPNGTGIRITNNGYPRLQFNNTGSSGNVWQIINGISSNDDISITQGVSGGAGAGTVRMQINSVGNISIPGHLVFSGSDTVNHHKDSINTKLSIRDSSNIPSPTSKYITPTMLSLKLNSASPTFTGTMNGDTLALLLHGANFGGKVNISRTFGVNSSGNEDGNYTLVDATISGSSSAQLFGSNVAIELFGSGSLTGANGIDVNSKYSSIYNYNTGTIPWINGWTTDIRNMSTGTVNNIAQIKIRNIHNSGGTVGTQLGLWIDDLSGATTNYSIYSGTAPSYFNGKIGIQETNPGTWALNVANDVYVGGTLSAGTLIDRTPYFSGDANAAILPITGSNDTLNHASLPDFLKASYNKPIRVKVHVIDSLGYVKDTLGQYVYRDSTTGYVRIPARNLGNSVTMAIKAIQQHQAVIGNQRKILDSLGVRDSTLNANKQNIIENLGDTTKYLKTTSVKSGAYWDTTRIVVGKVTIPKGDSIQVSITGVTNSSVVTTAYQGGRMVCDTVASYIIPANGKITIYGKFNKTIGYIVGK